MGDLTQFQCLVPIETDPKVKGLQIFKSENFRDEEEVV